MSDDTLALQVLANSQLASIQTAVAALGAGGGSGADAAVDLLILWNGEDSAITTAEDSVGAMFNLMLEIDGLAASSDLAACDSLAQVLASTPALTALFSSPSATNRWTSSAAATAAFVGSPTALAAAAGSAPAMAFVIGNSTALSNAVGSSTVMTAYAASSTAMTALRQSATARTAVEGSATAIAALGASPLATVVSETLATSNATQTVKSETGWIIGASANSPFYSYANQGLTIGAGYESNVYATWSALTNDTSAGVTSGHQIAVSRFVSSMTALTSTSLNTANSQGNPGTVYLLVIPC